VLLYGEIMCFCMARSCAFVWRDHVLLYGEIMCFVTVVLYVLVSIYLRYVNQMYVCK